LTPRLDIGAWQIVDTVGTGILRVLLIASYVIAWSKRSLRIFARIGVGHSC